MAGDLVLPPRTGLNGHVRAAQACACQFTAVRARLGRDCRRRWQAQATELPERAVALRKCHLLFAAQIRLDMHANWAMVQDQADDAERVDLGVRALRSAWVSSSCKRPSCES